LGSLLRSIPVAAIEDFLRHSERPLPTAAVHTVSIDEHAIPSYTRKFQPPKGYHTIRNKQMPVEKLSFSFHCGLRSLLSLVVPPGDGKLADIATTLLHRLRARLRGSPLYVLFDAGAAKHTDDLLRLVAASKQVTLVRAPRRPNYLAAWKRIPKSAWHRLAEPGPFTKARQRPLGSLRRVPGIRRLFSDHLALARRRLFPERADCLWLRSLHCRLEAAIFRPAVVACFGMVAWAPLG
jgi:hypothetical protein